MLVLVDYDNVDRLERQRGLVHIATRIFLLAGTGAAARAPRVRIRLYGGWFEGRNSSRLAQDLSAEIASDFPRPMPVLAGGHTPSVASMELAQSLLCDPAHPLTHTYRLRSAPPGIRPEPLPYSGCSSPSACPLHSMHAFLKQGRCPQQSCFVEPVSILRRAEQKLVDSMLICDLIHASRGAIRQVIVVSTDDDILPGIRMALLQNLKVTHIHPAPGRSTPPQYGHIATGDYRENCF